MKKTLAKRVLAIALGLCLMTGVAMAKTTVQKSTYYGEWHGTLPAQKIELVLLKFNDLSTPKTESITPAFNQVIGEALTKRGIRIVLPKLLSSDNKMGKIDTVLNFTLEGQDEGEVHLRASLCAPERDKDIASFDARESYEGGYNEKLQALKNAVKLITDELNDYNKKKVF